MSNIWKKIRMSLILTAIGAGIGLATYFIVGCPSGNCAITSSPFKSMLYMGGMGFLLSVFTRAGGCCCGGSCSTQDK